jgi:hypothetical protein
VHANRGRVVIAEDGGWHLHVPAVIARKSDQRSAAAVVFLPERDFVHHLDFKRLKFVLLSP